MPCQRDLRMLSYNVRLCDVGCIVAVCMFQFLCARLGEGQRRYHAHKSARAGGSHRCWPKGNACEDKSAGHVPARQKGMGGGSKTDCHSRQPVLHIKIAAEWDMLLHHVQRCEVKQTIPLCVKRASRMTYFYSDACGNKGGPYFPPKLDVLLAWSQLFRSKDTFCIYLNHVRTACILVKQPIEARESLQSASVNPHWHCLWFRCSRILA